MFDDYNHGSDMKKNGTGGYPILTGDSNGNFKDFNSNIIQNIKCRPSNKLSSHEYIMLLEY